jgi:hypothetical protein
VYVQPRAGLVCAIDHVEARLIRSDELELRNPTAFDAEVYVLIDHDPSIALDRLPLRPVLVSAGETIRESINRRGCTPGEALC